MAVLTSTYNLSTQRRAFRWLAPECHSPLWTCASSTYERKHRPFSLVRPPSFKQQERWTVSRAHYFKRLILSRSAHNGEACSVNDGKCLIGKGQADCPS